MKKRVDPCICIHRFLSQFADLNRRGIVGMKYEDELCKAEFTGKAIKAVAYEIINEGRYKIGECVLTIW